MNDNGERSRQVAVFFAAVIGGVFLTALIFFLIYQIRGVLPPFIYAFIIVYLLRPLVDFMVKKNIPRLLAVSAVYIFVFLLLAIFVIFLVPVLVRQVTDLVGDLPNYIKVGLSYFTRMRLAFYKIHFPKSVEPLLTEAGGRMRAYAVTIFSELPETTVSVFGGIFNIILAPIIAFYILKDLPAIKETITKTFPDPYRGRIIHVFKEIDYAVGGFLRGQVLVSLIVGTTIALFLLVFKVNFAVLLGVLAGVLNVIPYFGPIFGGGVAALVALFQSPQLALIVIIGMIVIQQLDSAIISPMIMKRTVNLHPAVVVFSLLVGGALFGFLGLLLAIPTAALAKALFLHYVFETDLKPESENS